MRSEKSIKFIKTMFSAVVCCVSIALSSRALYILFYNCLENMTYMNSKLPKTITFTEGVYNCWIN